MTDLAIHAPSGRLPERQSEGATQIGDNAEADLKRRIDRRVDLLDEAAELAAQLKEWKAEDKADGFTEAAIADAVKLRRADPEKVLAKLMLEAEQAVYRRAAGLPIDIAAAQVIAREAAESTPVAKKRAASGRLRAAESEAATNNGDF